jgi:dTMP kinase
MIYLVPKNKIHKMIFISIEGCDGSGKTTQARILQQKLINSGLDVVLTKEPGGSKLGNIMRGILLSNEISDSMTEFLLLSAARRDHILEIEKFLSQGKVVITDRFSDSSIAYQGYAKGLDIEKIELITEIVTNGFMPKITILLDVSLDVMAERMKGSEDHKTFYDMKGIDFHKKVKDGFLSIAAKYPERIVVVNGDKSLEEVSDEIWNIVSESL